MTPSSAVPPPVTAVIDRAGAWLPAQLGEVEGLLAATGGRHGPYLSGEAGSTLRAGGKRLRPLLVLICAGEEGGDRAARAATAIELVHMASLVHDDVLDAAPLRRGRETVVARTGRDGATAVGDLLFSRAFHLLAEAGDARSISLLSESSVALAQGELAQRADTGDLEVSEARYLERCRLKTATLFEKACLLGLAAGEAGEQPPTAQPTDRAAERMAAFGSEVGLAFQLLDDVLDVTGPPERTGKARGTDLLDGTVTLPLILARREAAEGRASEDASAQLLDLDLAALDPAGAERVCDAIGSTGALETVRRRGLDLVESAKQRISGTELPAHRRRLLELVAEGVVERYS